MAKPAEAKPRDHWTTLCYAGLLLLAAGIAWQALSKPEQWLSEEAARAQVGAAVALHGATIDHGGQGDHSGPDGGHAERDLAEARQRYADATGSVEAARWKRYWWPRAVQFAGVVLAISGVLGKRATGS